MIWPAAAAASFVFLLVVIGVCVWGALRGWSDL